MSKFQKIEPVALGDILSEIMLAEVRAATAEVDLMMAVHQSGLRRIELQAAIEKRKFYMASLQDIVASSNNLSKAIEKLDRYRKGVRHG